MQYKVSEIAKILGTSASAIRYYDKEGLLPFVKRTQGGVRLFDDIDYEFLQIINCLKSTGMPICDIKSFIEMVQIGDSSIDQRLELFYNRRKIVEKQIKELNDTLEIINYKCNYYETAKKYGSTEKADDICSKNMPKKLKCI